MTKERWAYLKTLQPSAGRYIHTSCPSWHLRRCKKRTLEHKRGTTYRKIA